MHRIAKVMVAGAVAHLLVCSASASAWNSRSHMMIAAVAYTRLTPAVKTRVDELLRLNPDRDNWSALIPAGTSATRKKMMRFMIAATWADRIKSNPAYHLDGSHNGNRPPEDPSASRNTGYDDFARHKYWHFEDRPFTQDNTSLPPIPTPNLRTQITAFREVLASPQPDALKSYDLSWLLHLIGDAHQPLHCTTRVSAQQPEGDDGGNGVNLTGSSADNLHSFWDGVLGGGQSPATALGSIANLPDPPTSAANDLDVSHWLDACTAAAQQTAYQSPPIREGAGPFTLTQAYKRKARKLAEQQVALAGARLANILNEELR